MANDETSNPYELEAGQWQARFTGPDGVERTAPTPFASQAEATSWLKIQEEAKNAGIWEPPLAD